MTGVVGCSFVLGQKKKRSRRARAASDPFTAPGTGRKSTAAETWRALRPATSRVAPQAFAVVSRSLVSTGCAQATGLSRHQRHSRRAGGIRVELCDGRLFRFVVNSFVYA